jgi:hypothetical protein
MTEIEHKNSENRGDNSVGQTIGITFATCAVLFLPTLIMWLYASTYCSFGGRCIDYELYQFGFNLAVYIPIIGFLSAIVISWFVVKLLKSGDTLVETVLTIIVTGGVLAMVFVASIYFRDMPNFDFIQVMSDLQLLFLPIIGMISVLVSRWFMTHILKIRDTFMAVLLSLIINGGLVVYFSFRLLFPSLN